MIRNKKVYSLDKLRLTNPQKAAVAKLLSAQKNKYKKLLHETHERLHIIADMTTSLEFWYNVNGNFEFISPSCLTVTGYEAQEFINSEIALEDLIHPEHHYRFRKDRNLALSGASGHEVEYRIIRKDGEHRWVKATWYPVYTRKEKHIGIRISIRDITEYKRCQLLARAYEQLTDLIADELVGVGIFSLDSNGQIVSWNHGAERLFGYGKKQVLNKPFALLAADASGALDFKSLETDIRHSHSMIFRRSDGSDFHATMMFFVLKDHKDSLHQITCLLRCGDTADGARE